MVSSNRMPIAGNLVKSAGRRDAEFFVQGIDASSWFGVWAALASARLSNSRRRWRLASRDIERLQPEGWWYRVESGRTWAVAGHAAWPGRRSSLQTSKASTSSPCDAVHGAPQLFRTGESFKRRAQAFLAVPAINHG